jgi:hypothetical protein
MSTEQAMQQIDTKLDEIDELLGELPLRGDKRKQLSAMVFKFWEELEDELNMMSSDWEG